MELDEKTGKPIVELSHSGLMTFNSCPKKFAFRKIIVNFNEERRQSDASAVGSALHEGIQEFMRSRSMDKAYEALILAHPIELQDPSKANVYSIEASITTLKHVLTDVKAGERCIADYDLAYFKKGDLTIPATEVAFLVIIELEHMIFHVRGFIDLVLQELNAESFFAVDIKTTTAQQAATLNAKYTYDWQLTSYGIPLNALLGSRAKFRTGILGVIQSDRDPQSLFPNYLRNQADIDSYHYYLIDSCRRIQRYWLDNQFPRGPSSCIAYGKQCTYFAQCTATSIDKMQLLVNPSKKPGDPPRPFDPVYIAKLEV